MCGTKVELQIIIAFNWTQLLFFEGLSIMLSFLLERTPSHHCGYTIVLLQGKAVTCSVQIMASFMKTELDGSWEEEGFYCSKGAHVVWVRASDWYHGPHSLGGMAGFSQVNPQWPNFTKFSICCGIAVADFSAECRNVKKKSAVADIAAD